MASIKYFESQKKNVISEAIFFFLRKHIDIFKGKFSPDIFRKSAYWSEPVDKCLKANLPFLQNIFLECSKESREEDTEVKPFISLKAFTRLFDDAKILGVCVGQEGIDNAYNYAMMT